MLNLFLVVDALIVISLIILSVMVLLHGGYKFKRNLALTLFGVFVAIWIPANHIGNDITNSPEVAQIANYFVFMCSFGAMILVMLFAVELAGIKQLSRITYASLPILLVIAVSAATPLVGQGVVRQDDIYGVVFGPFVVPYGGGLVYMITLTLVAVFVGLRHTRGITNNQLQVIGASLAIALPLVLGLGFIIPSLTGMFWLTEFGVMPIIIIVFGLYYSVIRHRLFDVRFVVVRGVAYICLLASLSFIYYLLAYVLSVVVLGGQTNDTVSVSPVNILLALFLTLIFQPIKQFFDRVTDKYFYKDSYSSDDFFSRMSQLLTSTTDLRGLLERISTEIAKTLKSEQVFFYLYQTGSANHYMSSGTNHHSRFPHYDVKSLDDYAMNTSRPVLLTEAVTDSSVRRMLVSHNVAVVVPLRTGKGIVGYVMLGEHLSGNFTKRDIGVLSTVSNELVVAIQNALSLHELKELNATLQQRIDVATKELRSSNAQLKHLDEVKDEFMSMASHQLRTPLTSVKGYISMLLEGDAGKVSPQQEKLLKEAFSSSERMVGLIADFLNISRLQTGKFIIEKEPTDIKHLIKQEISDLKLIADSHDMKLKLTIADEPLPVNADKAKLQQVVMNFVDNAIYYSSANSTIVINVERVKDEVAFSVKDTGIGVPVDEQNKLFTKFFRAKNARKQRPDGTGVGLYLARRVISAHGGSLIFSSVEGKGSTFGFRIPIDQHAEPKK